MKRCVRLDHTFCAFCLIFVFLSGCEATSSTRFAHTTDEEELPILWSDSGTYSRLTRNARIVARDWATLAQLPLTEVPVDFDTQMVLIVGLGPTAREASGVRITRVWRSGLVIRVQERQMHPGPGGTSAISVASPWTICVVPHSDLNVEGFESRVPKGLLSD